MGLYDVSSELELIREKTNESKVIYFGHSLGSAMGLIYSSVRNKEASEYLKCMVLLAAPSYFLYPKSPIFSFKLLGHLAEVNKFIEKMRQIKKSVLGYCGNIAYWKSFANVTIDSSHFQNLHAYVSGIFICCKRVCLDLLWIYACRNRCSMCNFFERNKLTHCFRPFSAMMQLFIPTTSRGKLCFISYN